MEIGFACPPLTACPRTADKDGGVRTRYENAFDICRIAEDLGFDFVTIGQHRFSPDLVDSSAPFVTLAALAARTTHIKLSPQIVLISTHNPVEVAEQAALVDEISNGRLILGVGVGYRPYEFDALGLDYSKRVQRFEEALQILRLAWREEPLSWQSEHFRINGPDVMPKPIQKSGPAIWVGAQADAAIRRAGRLADGWIAGFNESVAALEAPVSMFREEAKAAGRPGTLCLTRYTGIARTRAELNQNFLPAALRRFEYYYDNGVVWRGADHMIGRIKSGKTLTLDDMEPGHLVAGTPDDCVRSIGDIRARLNPEAMTLDFGRAAMGDTYEEIKAAIILFGREVLPRIR